MLEKHVFSLSFSRIPITGDSEHFTGDRRFLRITGDSGPLPES